jgi:glycosyltransferase involved in cell wall biosynthesis
MLGENDYFVEITENVHYPAGPFESAASYPRRGIEERDKPISISYIVSTYHRPDLLPCVLHSLKVQTSSDFEVLVTDNSTDLKMIRKNRLAVDILDDDRFQYCNVKFSDCYTSAEWGVRNAKGEFLCFPSDDSYYVPHFGELMLKAARKDNLELVYCNMIYDPRYFGHYWVLDVEARHTRIDKTGFLLKRDRFINFPGKINSACDADGYLIDELVRRGIKHGKIVDIMVVHN